VVGHISVVEQIRTVVGHNFVPPLKLLKYALIMGSILKKYLYTPVQIYPQCFNYLTVPSAETTTETAIETTALRTCPDMSGCTGNCQPDYSYLYDGCPVCLCVDPICGV